MHQVDPTRQLILIVVLVSLAWELYVGWRRNPPWPRRHALALAGALLFGVVVLAGGWVDTKAFFLALACFAILVVAPALLGTVIRTAIRTNRLDWALHTARLRLALQPSPVATRELELLTIWALVHHDRTDEALAQLHRAASIAGAIRRIEIHEQIVAALCYDRRFQEAIDYAQASIPSGVSTARPALAANVLRAYCEVGRLMDAAPLLEALVQSGLAEGPRGLELVHQAYVVWLSFAGQAELLDDLQREGKLLVSTSPAAQAYWRGIALSYAQRHNLGRAELLRARALITADEIRLRDVVDRRLKEPPPDAPAAEVVAIVPSLVARLTPELAVVRLARGRAWQTAPTTVLLASVLVGVFLLLEISGSSGDPWTLVNAGAQFLPAVQQGEFWRLVSATFLHAGWLHLVLNTYGLWMLGRFLEQAYGRARFFTLYVLSGVVGFVASSLLARVPLTVGASGGIFGLLGASIALFVVRRGSWPEVWRRGALSSLLFFTAVNLVIGFVFPMIDNAAHLGGLVSGALLGFLLVPGGRLGNQVALATVLTILAGGAIVYGTGGLISSRPDTLLTRIATRETALGPLTLRHPNYWKTIDLPQLGSVLADPLGGMLVVTREPDLTPKYVLADAIRSTVAQPIGPVGSFVGREFASRNDGAARVQQIWATDSTQSGSIVIDFSFPREAGPAYRLLARRMIATARMTR